MSVNIISVKLGNTRPDLEGVGVGGSSDELLFKTYFLWKIVDKCDTVLSQIFTPLTLYLVKVSRC